MKKAGLLFSIFWIVSYWSMAQKAEVFKLEKLYQPEVASHSFIAWQGESLLIPIRYDSKDPDPVLISFSAMGAHAEFYQLFSVEADFSAGFCGESKTNGIFEIAQIPDRAARISSSEFIPNSSQQWILAKVTTNKIAIPGDHPYIFSFDQKGKKTTIQGNIRILDRRIGRSLPLDFYSDFWQFPIALADYYQIKPWSKEHWEKLEIQFDQLAGINQHSLTTTVFWDLYNTRIRPLQEMMIQVKKDTKDEYSYDYSVFDRYVELGISKGISSQIAIHNLFPWNNHLFYWDESNQKVLSIQTAPGTSEYQAFWKPLLLDLAAHLREKGWLDRSLFFVDERDPTQTTQLIQWVKSLEPGFQFGFAGDFYPMLSPLIKDYSTPMNVVIDPSEMSQRILHAGSTSLYTSCFEKSNQPNFLMQSDLRDIYFLVHLAQAKGYQGILRWAFNLWSPAIRNSAIYSDLPSGDAHLVYPDGQVSVRYLVLQDALEELVKLEAVGRSKGMGDMKTSMNRYFLINIEEDRYQMIQAMKNYLNE